LGLRGRDDASVYCWRRSEATEAAAEQLVSEENPVRVIEVFIGELNLAALGFAGMTPAATGRPAYRPATLLKIDLYG
jgi:transposase